MKRTNIALIGCGFLGTRHLKCLNALKAKANITAICDHHMEHAQPLGKQYRVPVFADYRDIPLPLDAVSICTPTNTHAAIATYFLNKGVHAFVEKPMTNSLMEAEGLIDLAAQKGLKLQVGHVERFNSAFTAIETVAQNPLFVECHRLNMFPNRSLDIGVVMDLMIHDIDIILGLVKSPLKDIQAVGINVLTDKEDIANCRLTFANGCVCNVTASRISPEVTRKIRMFTKNAYISLDYAKQEASIYNKDERGISKRNIPIEKEEPLKKELEHFLDCVREDKTPKVSGVEGREALKIALDITQKIWEHRQSIS
ncbi:MAG: Gfo/Idh/MocA family oxidoreductase [Candidatus Omnitrophica bacterium]|nr:Gfo/Idh/MocA family oxidoreductase [Candidatus Omnitrophota bacterium]MDE2009091.1 Gfo/Idh/MocA family oxidoreductase [Candidatus Omnitrophota bacterium]MDE2231281.1 Gfo/Idh/MocA family oxidoreductase [Candidatus Omnitrophota bacterium]